MSVDRWRDDGTGKKEKWKRKTKKKKKGRKENDKGAGREEDEWHGRMVFPHYDDWAKFRK